MESQTADLTFEGGLWAALELMSVKGKQDCQTDGEFSTKKPFKGRILITLIEEYYESFSKAIPIILRAKAG